MTVTAYLVTGQTYTHRHALRAAGGIFNRDHDGYLFAADPAAAADLPGLSVESVDIDPADLAGETYEQRRERRAAKHAAKAERVASWADSHDRKADAHRARADGPGGWMTDWAAITQPITNNAGGRRFARQKEQMREQLRRESEERAKAAEQRAQASAAGGAAGRMERQEHDRGFIGRRIKEAEAEIRRLDRLGAAGKITDGWLTPRRDEQTQKLDYWRAKLDALGPAPVKPERVLPYGRHNVKPGDVVTSRHGGTYTVKRCNPNTVTVTMHYVAMSGIDRSVDYKIDWIDVVAHTPKADA